MNLDELLLFMDLRRGQATILAAVAEDEGEVDAARMALAALLRAVPMAVGDLGLSDAASGPRRWVQLTGAAADDAYVIGHIPVSPVAARSWAALVNGEREVLRDLGGPLVLVFSRATEQILRRQAIDFTTWINQICVLPRASEIAALVRQRGAGAVQDEPPTLPEDPIRFLHVSDLHLRPIGVKRYDQDKVLRGLLDFLERDRARFPLDLLFVTGDLAFKGDAKEYALVVDLLRTLMRVTSVPAERLFVVPGNHDVDREVGRWLLRTPAKGEDADAFFTDGRHRAFHAQKHAEYTKAMRALLGEARPLGLEVGEDAVELVEVRGAKIAVASFNSAWFAQGEDDHGKLWLGEANVDEAGQRVADLEAPFAVALMHHPTHDLHEEERNNVESYLERSFDLVVRGHLHRERSRSIATQRGGYVEVAGPAAYQGSQWPNGCFLGEIRPMARSVKLRPYAYASGPDPWVLDTKVFPDDEAEGHCRTFVVPEKRRLKGAVVRQRGAASDERVRAAPLPELRKLAESLGVVEPREELPKDVVERTTKAARANVNTAGLWAESTKAAEQRRFGAVMVGLMKATPISLHDPEFLRKYFLQLSHRFYMAKSAAKGQFEWTPERAKAAAKALVDIFQAPRIKKSHQSWRVEVWGVDGEPDSHRAIVLYGDFNAHPELERDAQHVGLQILDEYLGGPVAASGGLVLFERPGTTDLGPRLEQVKTPAGRDVLLLRL